MRLNGRFTATNLDALRARPGQMQPLAVTFRECVGKFDICLGLAPDYRYPLFIIPVNQQLA